MSIFRWTLTERATEKERYTVMPAPDPVTVDEFIRKLVARGHKVGAKDGSGIIAAVFKKGSRLEQKNVETCTGLILDIDGKFKQNGATVLEIIDVNTIIQQLPFRGVAHSSYNHSPLLPKFRIILPLAEEVTPAQHHRLWWWVYERINRKCDPACKNPDRMFYLPRCTQEAKDAKLPWVRELTGPLLSINDVPVDFAPAEVHTETGFSGDKQGGHFADPEVRKYPHTDAYALLETFEKLPLVHWARENAQDVSREVWRGIATNIAAIVLDQEDAQDDAAQLFHDISAEDEDRYDWNTTQKTFKDALKSARDFGPMTFDTMKLNGAPDEVCADPLGSGVKSPVALARRFTKEPLPSPKPQAPAPEPTPAPAGELIHLPKPPAPTPAASPETPPSTSSTSDVAAAPAATATAAPSAAPSTASSPKVVETSDPSAVAVDEEEQKEKLLPYKPEDFIFDMSESKYWFKDTKQDVWKGPFAEGGINGMLLNMGLPRKNMDSYKARIPFVQYLAPVFRTTEHRVKEGDSWVFNTYRPSTLEPYPGDFSIWQALILNLVGGDPDAMDYVLDWTAYPIQCLRDKDPDKRRPFKMGTACVFAGEPGSGKGTYMRMMKVLYGLNNVVTIGQEALDGRFTGILINKLFVVANEVISSTNRSAETANKVKPWITDETIPVERKHHEAEQVTNNFNIIFTSNDEKPILIEPKDRRYSFFKSRRLPTGLGEQLNDDLIGSKVHLAAFLDHLLRRQVKVKYGELYLTKERSQLIKDSLPSWDKFVADIQDDGFLSVASAWEDGAPPAQPREAVFKDQFVLASTLREIYQDYCRRFGIKPGSAAHLGAAMRAIKGVEDTRVVVSGVQVRCWTGLPMHPADAQVIPFVPPADVTVPVVNKTDNAEL